MMDHERLDRWLEKGILVFVLAIAVMGPVLFGGTRFSEFAFLMWGCLGAVILWIARIWLVPSYRLLWPPACWFVVLFAGYAVIRYMTADIEYVARQEMLKVLTYALLFLVVVNNLHRQEPMQIVLFSLVFLGMIESIYAIYQFATNSPTYLGMPKLLAYMKRGSGTYPCPNHLSGFLEMLLPIGLAFAVAGRIGYVVRVILIYASVMILAGIAATVSRGGWVATGCSLALMALLMLRKPQFRLPVLALIVALALGGVFFVKRDFVTQRRFHATVKNGDVENVRTLIWQGAYNMWLDNFWWGVGPDHFDYRYESYRHFDVQFRPERVHNDYLNTLTDWGMAGFLMVTGALAVIGYGVVKCWRYGRRSSNDLGTGQSNRLAAMIAVTIGVTAMLVHSLVDLNMHIPANAITCVIMLAFLSSYWRFATERFWRRPGWGTKIVFTIAAAGAVYYFNQQCILFRREFTALRDASRAGVGTPKYVEQCKKAFEIQPANFETAYELGYRLRTESFKGNPGYEKSAREAIGWYNTVLKLNPYYPFAYADLGMCLDWLEQHDRAHRAFLTARELAPNSYIILAYLGWHYIQIGDFREAKFFLDKSITLKGNPFAYTYRAIVDSRLKEPAVEWIKK